MRTISTLLALLPSSVIAPSPREADVIRLWDTGSKTVEIAQAVGCTQRNVQQILKRVDAFAPVAPVHPDLVEVVRYHAEKCGPNYGWNMLLGSLRSLYGCAWSFPRRQVYAVLHDLNPEAYAARRHWAMRRIGREIYFAPHFLYSVHIDLACKLQEYGLYVGAAVDGASRMVLSLRVLSDKLPVTIYDHIFSPMVEEYGLPDQLISDKGGEWFVAAFVSICLARSAGLHRRGHRFVQSKRNTRVERFNYEINMRVLVRFRRLINYLRSKHLLDKGVGAEVFAFATVAKPLMQFGCDVLCASWNHHKVRNVRYQGKALPGTGGVPVEVAKQRPHPGNGPRRLPAGFDGVSEYELVSGSLLNTVSGAQDMDYELCSAPVRRLRMQEVSHIIGDIEHAYIELGQGFFGRFEDAYLAFLSYYPAA